MGKMSQPKTDYGTGGESGERIPKGATASDTRGEPKIKVPMRDEESGANNKSRNVSNIPNSTASDRTGERKAAIAGGVGMGTRDNCGDRPQEHIGKQDGMVGEWNTGKTNKMVYKHAKEGY